MTPDDNVLPPIVLKPIARVKNSVRDPGRHDWSQLESEILFEPGFNEALEGIEEFSHITVLFWMHQSPVWDASTSKVHPQRRADLPLVGVLATHSPYQAQPAGTDLGQAPGAKRPNSQGSRSGRHRWHAGC